MTIRHSVHRHGMTPAAVAAILFLASLAIGLTFRHHYWDDPYIISVYARNLIRGNGLVFNFGERVLGTTTPLYTLVVALVGLFAPDIPTASCVLSALCTALLGLFIFSGIEGESGRLAGLLCAALVIFSVNSYMYVGIETYFYAMLAYGSFCLFSRRCYGPAAVMVGLSVLARPDGILAAAALFIGYLFRERRFPLPYAGLFLLVTLPWAAFAYWYYGDVLPQTFYAKKGLISCSQYFREYVVQGIGDWVFARNQQELPISPFILPAIGLIAGVWRSAYLRLCGAYAAAMIVGYTLIAPEDPWHSYPVMVAAFSSLGYGIFQVSLWAGMLSKNASFSRCIRVLVAAMLALPILLWQFSDLEKIREGYSGTWLGGPRHRAYLQTAQWLNINAAPRAVVLTLEPGTMAFYSNCIFYDYWGLISRKGWKVSWREADLNLKPDYVIWTDAEKEDKYPVPGGYTLRKIIEVAPFPRIFISEKTNHST